MLKSVIYICGDSMLNTLQKSAQPNTWEKPKHNNVLDFLLFFYIALDN